MNGRREGFRIETIPDGLVDADRDNQDYDLGLSQATTHRCAAPLRELVARLRSGGAMPGVAVPPPITCVLPTALMSFAFVPLYIRFMGMEGYGLIGVFTTMLAIFALLDLGLGLTVNRELARLSADDTRRADRAVGSRGAAAARVVRRGNGHGREDPSR